MKLQWHSFMIPGVFFVAGGIAWIGASGLEPLPLGAVTSGLFLLLAGLLKALEDREDL